jgi:hypothetical protein
MKGGRNINVSKKQWEVKCCSLTFYSTITKLLDFLFNFDSL